MIDWVAFTQNPALWIGIYCSSELLIAYYVLGIDLKSQPKELTSFSLALIPTGLFMSIQHLIAYGRLLDPWELQAGQICHGWAGLVFVLIGLTFTMYLSGRSAPKGAHIFHTQFPMTKEHHAIENSTPQFHLPSLSGERASTRHSGPSIGGERMISRLLSLFRRSAVQHDWWIYDEDPFGVAYFCHVCGRVEFRGYDGIWSIDKKGDVAKHDA